MVVPMPAGHPPTRREVPGSGHGGTPLLWRVLLVVGRLLVALTGRLVVTGRVPDELRGRRVPVLLAANHIGVFDVVVLVAASHRLGIAPRFLATGGLFDARFVGGVLRACGHIRVDRGKGTAVEAVAHAAGALGAGSPVLAYPEGRISLDPGLWPERGKSGVARLALTAGTPVLPIAQWGAHEAVCWGTPTVESWPDLRLLLVSWARAIRTRPTFREHVGPPVDLTGLRADRVGDARRAHERIMRALTAALVPLRRDEPDLPRFQDPTRPVTGRSPWRP